MDCKKIREMVFLFADDEMSQETLTAFETHVRFCPDCAEEARYARRLVSVVRQRTVRTSAPSALRARILSLMPHRQTTLS